MPICECVGIRTRERRFLRLTQPVSAGIMTLAVGDGTRYVRVTCGECDGGIRWVGSRLVELLFDIEAERLAGAPLAREDWQVRVIEPSEGPAVLRELAAPITDGEVRVQLDLQRTDNW